MTRDAVYRARAATPPGGRRANARGYYLDSATAFFADCNIDIEYSLEASPHGAYF